jgi:hypothetical protein
MPARPWDQAGHHYHDGEIASGPQNDAAFAMTGCGFLPNVTAKGR